MEWYDAKKKVPDITGHYLIVYSREICANEMAVAFFSREEYECDKDSFANPGWEYSTYGDHKEVLYWTNLPNSPDGCKCYSF